MHTMRLMKTLLKGRLTVTIAVAVFGFAPALMVATAQGASIGINFVGDNAGGPGGDGDDIRSMATTDTAGVVPQTNWNNYTGTNGILSTLNFGDGTLSTAAVTVATFNNNYTAHDNTGAPSGDQILTNGYIDETDGTPGTITISGIVSTTPYDVYVYVGSDGNDRTGSGNIGSTTYFFSTNTNPFDNTYTRATDTVSFATATDNSEYLLFEGVTGPTFTYTQTKGSNNVGVHGIQIVGITPVPEPASVVLGICGLGAIGLLAVRRRKA